MPGARFMLKVQGLLVVSAASPSATSVPQPSMKVAVGAAWPTKARRPLSQAITSPPRRLLAGRPLAGQSRFCQMPPASWTQCRVAATCGRRTVPHGDCQDASTGFLRFAVPRCRRRADGGSVAGPHLWPARLFIMISKINLSAPKSSSGTNSWKPALGEKPANLARSAPKAKIMSCKMEM